MNSWRNDHHDPHRVIELGRGHRTHRTGAGEAGGRHRRHRRRETSFVQAARTVAAAAGAPLSLIDLDPGQKMIGPPGTAGLGRKGQIERLVFIGSTSASELSKITAAATVLASCADHRFITNTAGFIRGLGAKVQSSTISALGADLIVGIGEQEPLRTIVDAHPNVAVIWLGRSELARRKTPSERAKLRQAAFDAALRGAEPVRIPVDKLSFSPRPPAGFHEAARPICALATSDGEVRSIGILEEVGEEITILTKPPHASTPTIQLGKMWAKPTPAGWKLLEQLSPAWPQIHLPKQLSPDP